MATRNDKTVLSRRDLLTAAVAMISVTAVPFDSIAGQAEADEMLKKLIGDAKPQAGKITLKLPEVAENGGSVPMTISCQSAMTDKDYCKSIHVVADGNPLPGICSFHFTPAAGKAEASLRIRMAKTQTVKAVAVMSDGSVYQAAAEIKVTIGGC